MRDTYGFYSCAFGFVCMDHSLMADRLCCVICCECVSVCVFKFLVWCVCCVTGNGEILVNDSGTRT